MFGMTAVQVLATMLSVTAVLDCSTVVVVVLHNVFPCMMMQVAFRYDAMW